MRFDDYSRDLTIDRRPDAPQTPTVSVILPTYVRGDGMLGRAIDSILSQSYGDLELIVVDDGSRDGTADLLSTYRQADPRVTIHRYRLNSGLPALRVNQAALAARGRLIGYQFDDDLWMPDSLAVRVEALQGRDKPTVVYGSAEIDISAAGQPSTTRQLGGPFNYGRLVGGNFIANNSVLHPVELFDIAGMYDPHIISRRYSDYDLWLRFGALAEFVSLDVVVSKVHAFQLNSLGMTVPLDYTVFRKYVAIDRTEALKPAAIRNYDVSGTAQLRQAFADFEIDQIRRRTIIPFLALHHDHASMENLLPAMISRRSRKTLLVAKPDFSTSVDVTIHNFTHIENSPYRNFFVPEREIDFVDWGEVDTAVMYRTVSDKTTSLLRALRTYKAFAYLMDDNMLRFDEVGPENVFLAPGTPAGLAIRSQIADAHACIGYSDQIVADMQALNPRTLRLNTNIPLRFLEPRPYRRSPRLSVAVLSGPVRRDVLRTIWPALVAFAESAPDAIEFHFWGLDPAEFGQLPCPVHWQPFTHAYDLYRSRLMDVAFDILVVPLDEQLKALHSKSPVKLLEAVCCGAICIFTDTPPYRMLPDDICLKTPNTTVGWQAALENARAMGTEKRAGMLERARAFAQEHFATEHQLADFTATFDAIDLHRRLDRRRIAYVFHETALGGATLHLLRHAALARSLGFEVVGVINETTDDGRKEFEDRWRRSSGDAPLLRARWRIGYRRAGPDNESGRAAQVHRTPDLGDQRDGKDLAARLNRHQVGLIHAATWNPIAAFAGRSLNVPVALSLHQFMPIQPGAAEGIADAIHCSSLRYARDWEEVIKKPVRRIVCPVESVFFGAFIANLQRRRRSGTGLKLLVSGTIQPRKNQLEAIRAVGLLTTRGLDVTLDLVGYDDLVPGYSEACRQEITALGLQDRVRIHGFTSHPEAFYRNRCDILLMASDDESMPQSVLQAMAAGLLVVTTEVGGIGEILRHRYGCIVARGTDAPALADAIGLAADLTPDQIEEILRRAHRSMDLIARESYVRAELVDFYNEAYENWETRTRPRLGKVTTVLDRVQEVGRLQARIRQLESSLSFRVTAPLRAVARKLRPIAWLANRIR
jgi:glycosyltransferase involved in cell wall biosynthesis